MEGIRLENRAKLGNTIISIKEGKKRKKELKRREPGE